MSQNEHITDELLVVHVQEGSAEAFELLVKRWQERVWRFAWRLTDDEQASWDVSQETWSAISRGIRDLEDATAFPAWAYQIAGNKSRDWIRRRQRRQRADGVYVERRRQAEQERPGGRAALVNLKDALSDMSDRDRTILALRYEQEFNTDEIAAILGIPPGTVKSRLYYARGRLRHFLKEEDNE